MSAPRSDVSGDVIWVGRGLHFAPEVCTAKARATRPSTARQYIAVDAVRDAIAAQGGPDDDANAALTRLVALLEASRDA